MIDNAVGQRLLRPHHGQIDLLFAHKGNEAVEVERINRYINAVLGGAGIAGSAINSLCARRLSQLPHQGMFAAAFADNQYLHRTCNPKSERNTSVQNSKNQTASCEVCFDFGVSDSGFTNKRAWSGPRR